MENFDRCFNNIFDIVAGKNSLFVVKISWGEGYTYKIIDNGEEIKDKRYKKANLYVESA